MLGIEAALAAQRGSRPKKAFSKPAGDFSRCMAASKALSAAIT
jgi:hypothetical protein